MIIEDFLRYMETERVASPATVATYREVLADFSEFVDSLDNQTPETVDSDVIRDWLGSLMEKGLKASYVCKQLSAVKSMYKFALAHGMVEKDPAHLVTGPKRQKVLPVFLKEKEADRLLMNSNGMKIILIRFAREHYYYYYIPQGQEEQRL